MPNCSRCDQPPHDECRNGSIVVDDPSSHWLKARECPNLKVRRTIDTFNKRIPAVFLKVPMAKQTPLFVPRGPDSPGVDLIDQNLFITGVPWNPTFISHLKKVLFVHPGMTYQIVSDTRIKDVWLGSETYKSKPVAQRDTVETHNTIEDLMAPSYELVVVLLGQLIHKNSASANVLRQALMHRHNFGKPTWLFQSSDPGASWDLSRNLEVEEFVKSHYTMLDLDEGTSPRYESRQDEGGIVVDDASEEEAPELEERAFVPNEARGSASSDVDIDSMLGDMYSDKKKFKKRKW